MGRGVSVPRREAGRWQIRVRAGWLWQVEIGSPAMCQGRYKHRLSIHVAKAHQASAIITLRHE
jgi:hypothetical protein